MEFHHMDFKSFLLLRALNAVEKQDLKFFYYNQSTLNAQLIEQAFYHSCNESNNSNIDFTLSLANLGVSEKQMHDCCVYAFHQQNYALLKALIINYGKSHQINIFETIFTDSKRAARMVMEPENLELFEHIVRLAPNHTKRIRNTIKYYHNYDFKDYATLYNNALNGLISTYIYLNQVPENQSEIKHLVEAIKILCQKKFPIYRHSLISLQKYGFDFIEDRRTQCKTEAEGYDRWHHSGLASKMLIVSHDFSQYDCANQKIRVFYELSVYMGIPHSVFNHVYYSLGKNLAPIIPNNNDFSFLQSIEHKPCVFQFFNRYYLVERKKLYDRLNVIEASQEDNCDYLLKI
jgi:hypothetical protein